MNIIWHGVWCRNTFCVQKLAFLRNSWITSRNLGVRSFAIEPPWKFDIRKIVHRFFKFQGSGKEATPNHPILLNKLPVIYKRYVYHCFLHKSRSILTTIKLIRPDHRGNLLHYFWQNLLHAWSHLLLIFQARKCPWNENQKIDYVIWIGPSTFFSYAEIRTVGCSGSPHSALNCRSMVLLSFFEI